MFASWQRSSSQKSALVTGAAKRIGRAIALDLARHGWAVAVHYHRSAAEAAELVREIEDGGGRAVALQADLAHEAHTHALIARAVEALGPLTCLVNNASLFEMDKIETATRAVLGRSYRDRTCGRRWCCHRASRASCRRAPMATLSTCWTSGSGT